MNDEQVLARPSRARWWARARLGALPVDLVAAVVPGYLLSRALVLVVGVLAVRLLPLQPGDGVWPGAPAAPLLAALSRWDGKWYLSIAEHGYASPLDYNFAPGYPALIRLVGQASGRTDTDGLAGIGILLANLALLAALGCLYLLGRRLYGGVVGRRAVLWLVCFPTTFYLSAVYPESLFLALALGSFLLALDRRWALAALVAMPAAVTRNYGLLLVVPLAWEFLVQHHRRPRRSMAWLLLVPAAFVLWQAAFWAMSGDPLAMSHAAEQWGRRLTAPWEMLRYYLSIKYWTAYLSTGGSISQDHSPVDIAGVLLFGALVLLSFRLRPRSLGLLAAVLYLPTISTGGFLSMWRYGLELFPVFLLLARLTGDRRLLVPALAAAVALGVVATAWFAIGGWLA